MSKKKYGPTPKKFTPYNKEKYKGTWPIISRSSLETKAFYSMDQNPAIISWSSESLVIPYYDPGKKKKRRYYTDLTFTVLDINGLSHTYVAEIKMEIETHKPQRGKKQEKTFLKECFTYVTNKSKWTAAKEYCDRKGYRFVLWTENGLRHYDPQYF